MEVKFSSTLVSSEPDFPEHQDQRSSLDQRSSPDQQSLGDCVASFRPDPCRDSDLFPSTSAENWVKADEDGEEESEVFQHICLDSEPENDSGETELSESGPSRAKSKKKGPQMQTRSDLSASEQTDPELFDCVMCGQSFQGESALKTHMESHLCTNYEIPAQRYSDDNLCYLCGKTFSTRSHLKRHLLVHTGQKPHCCQECGKRFSRRESLCVHMRVHSVEKPYTCELCGRGFKQRSNMVCHVRTHTGVKPHSCAFCSKSFTLKKDMLRHMEVHAMKS